MPRLATIWQFSKAPTLLKFRYFDTAGESLEHGRDFGRYPSPQSGRTWAIGFLDWNT